MNYVMFNTAGKTTEILLSAFGKEEYFSDENCRAASQILLPALDKMLDDAGARLSDMDFFGCVIGPGSFTGIRIGAVTVKTLCYALKKKAAAIDYNRLISLCAAGKRLAVVYGWADMYYAALIDGEETVMSPTAMKSSEIAQLALEKPEYSLVCDRPSFDVFGGICADERLCMKKAALDAALIDGDMVVPLYAMKSQAERDLEK